MPELTRLQEHIGKIFEEKLHLVVPSVDTDLFVTGGLDSLSFVELLFELEREYGLKVSLQDLELRNFQSIASIAGFIAGRLERAKREGEERATGPVGRRQVEHG